MSPWRILAFSGFALVAAHAANAMTTYYNTYDPSWTMSPDSFDVTMGNSFTAASPAFTVVQLLLSADSTTDGGTTTVYLAADDGTGTGIGHAGSPDMTHSQVLGIIPDSSLSSSQNGPSLLTFFMSASASVANNTSNNEYWIVLAKDANSSLSWYWSADVSQIGAGIDGQAYYTANDAGSGTTLLSDGNNPFSMIVDTPEPGALVILGAGLAALGFVRRRIAG